MAELKIPQALIDAAKAQGVNLDSTIKYDAEGALYDVSAFFNGESDFGFSLGKAIKRATGHVATHASAQASLKLPMRKPVTAFAIPQKMSVFQALGAADKLLGNTGITNRPQVIQATRALAALGDPAAQRGLATLTTAAKIRSVKKVPPGKKAIPNAPAVKTSAVAKKYDKSTVFNMAQSKLISDSRKNANLSLIQKIKKFFGLKI